MSTIKAKKLKTGMFFYGRVIPDSQSCGVDGIEIDDISGIITKVTLGGQTLKSITIEINDDETLELSSEDKVAIDLS